MYREVVLIDWTVSDDFSLILHSYEHIDVVTRFHYKLA